MSFSSIILWSKNNQKLYWSSDWFYVSKLQGGHLLVQLDWCLNPLLNSGWPYVSKLTSVGPSLSLCLVLKSIAAALSRCLRRLKMARTGYSGEKPGFQKRTFISLGGLDNVNVSLFIHLPKRESDKSQNQIWLWDLPRVGCMLLLFCSTLHVAITARLVVQCTIQTLFFWYLSSCLLW